jgi:23S rRNA pseudouridine1911/1915/1917 synthase
MMSPESEILIITEAEAGQRLDKILALRFSDVFSRTYFQWLIEENYVILNGEPVKKRIRPVEGDQIEIQLVLTPEINLEPEDIPLNILYEDEDLIAVNKPAGMVVHPAAGNWSGTFVNALLYHCRHLPEGQMLRPGIVHRLDKGTTGVLIAAKSSQAQQRLIELFAARGVYKEYLAVCVGNPGKGKVDAPIARHPVHRQKMCVREEGRKAVTHYRTVSYHSSLSVVELILETGRTHQIRVHMQSLGTPVLGDPLYGSASMNQKFTLDRQMLHASRIRLPHPIHGRELELIAPIPEDMHRIMSKIA